MQLKLPDTVLKFQVARTSQHRCDLKLVFKIAYLNIYFVSQSFAGSERPFDKEVQLSTVYVECHIFL